MDRANPSVVDGDRGDRASEIRIWVRNCDRPAYGSDVGERDGDDDRGYLNHTDQLGSRNRRLSLSRCRRTMPRQWLEVGR